MLVGEYGNHLTLLLKRLDLNEVFLIISGPFGYENRDSFAGARVHGDGELITEHSLVNLTFEPLRHGVLSVDTATCCTSHQRLLSRYGSTNVIRLVQF